MSRGGSHGTRPVKSYVDPPIEIYEPTATSVSLNDFGLLRSKDQLGHLVVVEGRLLGPDVWQADLV